MRLVLEGAADYLSYHNRLPLPLVARVIDVRRGKVCQASPPLGLIILSLRALAWFCMFFAWRKIQEQNTQDNPLVLLF